MAHSIVLRLLSLLNPGRRGDVFVVCVALWVRCFFCFATGLPLASTPLMAVLSDSARASSATALRSVELLETPRLFCSRRDTILAGDLRVCGSASSSMVLPRDRFGEVGVRSRLRSDMETRLRSLRFGGRSHGRSSRLKVQLAAGELCCAMHYDHAHSRYATDQTMSLSRSSIGVPYLAGMLFEMR